MATLNPFERLRQIWTPERELHEHFTSLDPQSELDSFIRECFSRIVERDRTFTLSRAQPVGEGTIRWETINREIAPGVYEEEVTFWWQLC